MYKEAIELLYDELIYLNHRINDLIIYMNKYKKDLDSGYFALLQTQHSVMIGYKEILLARVHYLNKINEIKEK